MSGDQTIGEKIALNRSSAKKSCRGLFYAYSILLLACLIFSFNHYYISNDEISDNEIFSIIPILSLTMVLFAFIKFKIYRIPTLIIFGFLSLPLIINAMFLVYQQLLFLVMGGISVWGTDFYIQFANDTFNTLMLSLYFINQIAIIIVSSVLI